MANAKPDQIIIIRHAEKPDGKSEDLSEKGFLRAEALKRLFDVHPELAERGRPDFLFAAKYSPGESSKRSLQTITPLSVVLNLKINTDHLTDDYQDLVQDLMQNPKYLGRSVLIAWTHSNIPAMAKSLGSAPRSKWDSDVFDRLWVIRYDDQGRANSVDLPQKLLPGDSD